MKKLILLIITVLPLVLSAQTITKPPIFTAKYKSLTVKNGGCNTCIMFLFQHPDYNTFVDIVSFTVPSIDDAIALTDKMIEILEMPETGKEEHIHDNYKYVNIVRYGFQQKAIHVGSEKKRQFSKPEINKLRLALIEEKSKI
jgi:hypothetical protein